jgi:HAD superfamily hydrolase (TIGR01509 family)
VSERKIDLVIFDCDGVLVDSERIAIRIDVEVIRRHGWDITEAEVIDLFVGRSDSFMRDEVARRTGRELGADWDTAFVDDYRAALERELTAVDGIVEALDAIDERALATCVASSGSHDKMRFTLGLTDLWDRFDGRIFSASEVERGKPAPDLFVHAARQMNVHPRRCAVVEDSAAGVEAALAADMHVIAYAGGVTPRVKLERPGATIIDDMRHLPAAIASIE